MARERGFRGEWFSERVPHNNNNNNSYSFNNIFHGGFHYSQSKITTAFVANIPHSIDSFGLKGVFSKAGKVLEVYIPLRQGTRLKFGFVRFANREALNWSVRFINNSFVRGNKLIVQEARSTKRRHLLAVKPFGSHLEAKSGRPLRRFESEDVGAVGSKVREKLRVLKGEPNALMIKWLLNSLVAESDASVSREEISDLLCNQVEGLVRVVTLQWNKVILHFSSEDLACRALLESQILHQTFTDVRRWSGHDRPLDKPVWLEISGVPPSGWKKENFVQIASLWGTFVFLDNNFESTESFESLEVLVITKSLIRIEEEFIFSLEDQGFRICVKEVDSVEKQRRILANNSSSQPTHVSGSPPSPSPALVCVDVMQPLAENIPQTHQICPSVVKENISPGEDDNFSIASHGSESAYAAPIQSISQASVGVEVQGNADNKSLKGLEKGVSEDSDCIAVESQAEGQPFSSSKAVEPLSSSSTPIVNSEAEILKKVSSPQIFHLSDESSGPPPGFESLKIQPSAKKIESEKTQPSAKKKEKEKEKKKVLGGRKKCMLPQGRATNRLLENGSRFRQSQTLSRSITISPPSNKTSDSTLREFNDTLEVGNILGLKPKKNPEGYLKNLKNAVKDHKEHKRMRVGPSGV